MQCDQAAETVQNLAGTWSQSSNTLTISMASKHACTFDIVSFWDKLGNFQYVVQIVIAVASLAMCLFGIRIYKISLGIIGFLAGGGAAYLLMSLFIDVTKEQNNLLWVAIVVSVLAGVLCCVLLICIEKLGFIFGGGVLGYVLGTLLYDLFLHRFDTGTTPVVYYITIITLAIILGIVALWLHDIILILATAVGGSYTCARMIGLMLHNYPDESTIAARINAGEIQSLPVAVYIYISGMLAFAVVGIILQCCIKKKVEEKKANETELIHV